MTTMKMRKVMLTATLLTMTACAGVDEGNAVEPDDMGSGSAEETAGTVTIDPSDFVVDGGTWWTTTNAPQLRGTFDAKTSVTITVQAGANPPVSATLTDKQWSAQLPPDSIASSAVDIKVTMTATSGAKSELVQTFGLDSAPPSVRLVPSKVRDERGDQIDFSAGEPVHTHVGAEIDLATGVCPSVYKYRYLMDGVAPTFGTATSPNELAWRVRISDAKLQTDSQLYRVRSDNGQTLINWDAMPAADGNGISTIRINGKNVPLLGSRNGKYFIDVRAKDWTDLETTSTFCFDFHGLQAPLHVEPIQTSELFDMTFANNSAMSSFIGGEGSVVIATQTIVQHTAEPVTLTYVPAIGSTSYTASKFFGWVEESYGSQIFCQPDVNSDPRCKILKPVGNAPTLYNESGMPGGTYTVELIDSGTSAAAAVVLQRGSSINYVIPGRAANARPHAYTLQIRVNYGVLNPGYTHAGAAFGDHTLLGRQYTGQAPIKGDTGCTKVELTAFGWMCSQMTTFWSITALDRATIEFASIGAAVKLGDHEPAYVPASTMTMEALTWDTGDADIPGSQF